jgi:pimeloyl-ACP methyl ester carboxylesterase
VPLDRAHPAKGTTTVAYALVPRRDQSAPSAGTVLYNPGGTPPARHAAMPDVPALVLSGDLDANTPSSAGRKVARQFAHATFAEIPNAGHTPTDTPRGLQLALRFVASATGGNTVK